MKREGTYTYKIVKTSWGIYIELKAEAVPLSDAPNNAFEVEEGIWLAVNFPDFNVMDDEYSLLELAVHAVSPKIRAVNPSPLPLVINLKAITVLLTDYQPEGIVCAIIGWAGLVFGFDPPQVPVAYDKTRNRYVFDFSGLPRP